MLSGDLNVVDLQWTVQYKIGDPKDFLFQVKDVDSAIRDMSESVMRRVVGNRLFDFVLTVGRAEIADRVKVEMQKVLDSYRTGIQVVNVKMQNVTPPAQSQKSTRRRPPIIGRSLRPKAVPCRPYQSLKATPWNG
jgi:membrane protease subunit HflK